MTDFPIYADTWPRCGKEQSKSCLFKLTMIEFSNVYVYWHVEPPFFVNG